MEGYGNMTQEAIDCGIEAWDIGTAPVPKCAIKTNVVFVYIFWRAESKGFWQKR